MKTIGDAMTAENLRTSETLRRCLLKLSFTEWICPDRAEERVGKKATTPNYLEGRNIGLCVDAAPGA